MKLILASKSPRRKELLELITPDFEIVTEEVDERAIESELKAKMSKDETMREFASKLTVRLSESKASAVFGNFSREERENIIVIGADTCVVTEDEILGKPEDKDDARRMLKKLSGTDHYVITGVSIIASGVKDCFFQESTVRFNELDEYQLKRIEEYIGTNDPYDKAGAYGIQTSGSLLIKEISGDYFNIVGLPVSVLARHLNGIL